MDEIILITGALIGLLSAILFAFKWFNYYIKIKGFSLNTVFNKGIYRPKYIENSDKDFKPSDIKTLNKIHILMSLSLGLAILFIAIALLFV